MVHADRQEVSLGEGVERLFDFRVDRDPLSIEGGFVGVVLLVVRREVASGEVLAEIQQAGEGLPGMLPEPFPRGQSIDAEPLEQQKVDVAAG